MNKFSIPQPVSGLGSGFWGPVSSSRREGHEGMSTRITLVTGQRSHTRQRMHALIVELALAGPVKVLIGGNHYDHYRINYALAAATPRYEHILGNHIHLSRAETCYQMVELLAQTQTDPVPTLVLDLLTTFYDEGAPEREINQLLFEAILELRRLSRGAPVVVGAHSGQDRPWLLEVIKNAVDRVEGPEASWLQPIRQPSLIG